MVSSMTGFGREVHEAGGERIAAEVKSVNGRGLKLSVRLPDSLASRQADVEALLRGVLDRGSVFLEVEHRAAQAALAYGVDRAQLTRYAEEVRAVKDALGVQTPLEVERLLPLPGVIVARPAQADEEGALWLRVRGVIERALASLGESRRREGTALAADLRGRRAAIGERLASVKARLPEVVQGYRAKLTERLRGLLAGESVGVEPAALVREAALLAERTDVSEELSRLDAHLRELDRCLDEKGPVGRRLEFLAQEMHREANTMGSKTQESSLVHDILAIKLEIDKIKEQTANVE